MHHGKHSLDEKYHQWTAIDALFGWVSDSISQHICEDDQHSCDYVYDFEN